MKVGFSRDGGVLLYRPLEQGHMIMLNGIIVESSVVADYLDALQQHLHLHIKYILHM